MEKHRLHRVKNKKKGQETEWIRVLESLSTKKPKVLSKALKLYQPSKIS